LAGRLKRALAATTEAGSRRDIRMAVDRMRGPHISTSADGAVLEAEFNVAVERLTDSRRLRRGAARAVVDRA
jgi:hypothetical protein